MLRSQFSAIFAILPRSKWRFSKKNLCYHRIFALFSFVLSQKRQYFVDFFSKIFKKS
jgi:hypothetical protein